MPAAVEVFSTESVARKPELKREHSCLLYVGTYTNGESKGIYALRFLSGRGTLIPIGLVAETVNPSFLAVHPNKRFLYAIGEVKQYQGQSSGLLSAYAIDAETGALTLLDRVASRGAGPCHVAVDRSGSFVIVSNYVGGSVAVFRILGGGRLGGVTAFVEHSAAIPSPSDTRQPLPHGAFLSPDNWFVMVPDKGLDKVFVYRLDQDSGALERADAPSTDLPPGAGPRHLVFHPSGRHAYVLNELDSTIVAFCYQGRGALQPMQSVPTLPADFHGESFTAEIEIDREGRFLYSSNRGADSITVFAISTQGRLYPIKYVPSGGRTPRHFMIDPSGHYLLAANQHSDNVVLYRRDRHSGRLTPVGQPHHVPSPACLVLAPQP